MTLMFMCWQIISWIVAAQAFRHGVEADEIGGGLGQAAQSVVQETRPQNNVVGARGVVDMKGFPAAIIDHQVFKIVADALGVGTEHPAPGGVSGGLCHENPVMMTLGNDQALKRIVPGVAHENAQIVARQYRIGDGIMAEVEVQ